MILSGGEQRRIANPMKIGWVNYYLFLIAMAMRFPLAVKGFLPKGGSYKNRLSHRSMGQTPAAVVPHLLALSNDDNDDENNTEKSSRASLAAEVVESVLKSASEELSEQTNVSNQNSVAFRNLFQATLQRAYSTNAMRNNNVIQEETIEEPKSVSRYSNTTETKKQRQQTYKEHSKEPAKRYEFPFATSYKSHPALNNVALAHALWASVVRPNVDTIIDATCGNGNDSIVLGEILFGDSDDEASRGELVCLDIQQTACQRTTEALKDVLPSSIRVIGHMDDSESSDDDYCGIARVVQMSHERLPRPTDTSSVGLIVYNLGWLPGNSNDDGKECVTKLETTLASLVDAVSLLRVGGMLSVVTYPTTSSDEHEAVKLLVTCLALQSSRTRTWEEEIENYDGEVANHVRMAMETIVSQQGGPKIKTWRVSQHDKLGMESPPVLFTATRIK